MRRLSGLLLVSVLILAGCSSIPLPRPADEKLSWLPADSKVFLNMNIGDNRPLLDAILEKIGMDNKSLKSLINKSQAVCLGLENPLELSNPGIHLIADGNYNSTLISWGLRMTREWARTDKEIGIIADETGKEIIPTKGNLYFSQGKAGEIIANKSHPLPVYLPRDVREHFINSDIILYYPQPSREVLMTLSPRLEKLDVDLFYLAVNKVKPSPEEDGTIVVPEDQQYEILGLVRMDDPKMARPFSLAMKWVILGVIVSSEDSDTRKFLKDIKIGTNHNDIEMTGLTLTIDKASDLISSVVKLDIYDEKE